MNWRYACTQAHRNFWRYAPKKYNFRAKKSWILTIVGLRPTTMGLRPKQKSCTWPLRTWWNFFISWLLFLSCIFWPPGVKKSGFFTIFGTFQPFWRTSLPERKKNHKMKSCALSIPIWSVASVFSFSVKKWIFLHFLHISAIFWHISAILEDFLTGKEKKI